MNKELIGRILKKGFRFSVTLDEYTRLGNRKLCNINLHIPDGDFLRIGMVRVRNKCTAEVVKDVLEKKLNEYSIDIEKDVICHTTDGASVMTKMAKLLKIVHQICLAHGMHLAVCDVLYKAKKSNESEASDKDEHEDDEEDEDEELDWLGEETVFEPELIMYADIIAKVRKIVRKFRRSTTANDALQDEVMKILGEERMLQIDVK